MSDLLTMREVQYALNLTYFKVREFEMRGALPHELVGGMVRFKSSDVARLKEWMAEADEQARQQKKLEFNQRWRLVGLCDCREPHRLNARSPKGSQYLYRQLFRLTRHADWPSHRTSSLNVLSIRARTKNCILSAHASTLGGLVTQIEFITRQPGFGSKSVVDLRLAINKFIKDRDAKFSSAVKGLFLTPSTE